MDFPDLSHLSSNEAEMAIFRLFWVIHMQGFRQSMRILGDATLSNNARIEESRKASMRIASYLEDATAITVPREMTDQLNGCIEVLRDLIVSE